MQQILSQISHFLRSILHVNRFFQVENRDWYTNLMADFITVRIFTQIFNDIIFCLQNLNTLARSTKIHIRSRRCVIVHWDSEIQMSQEKGEMKETDRTPNICSCSRNIFSSSSSLAYVRMALTSPLRCVSRSRISRLTCFCRLHWEIS